MATREEAYEKALQVKISQVGDVDIVSSPETSGAVEALIALQQNRDNLLAREDERTHELNLGVLQGQTQTTIADFNLQGVRSQSEATRFAAAEAANANKFAASEAANAAKFGASQAAEATKFSATEGARGQIESQRVASESQERQVGLKGVQDRLLAVEQGSQERLNIETTGRQQRETQAQLLGSQERQIGLTGEQQRLLAQEQGRQQRETDLQQEQFRRYKEAKDAAQAARAFRA